jgi:hypothetical protein
LIRGRLSIRMSPRAPDRTRENSGHWQRSTYLAGKNGRKTTNEESVSHAKEIAEDWYLELRGKARAGVLKTGKSFREAAKHFLSAYVTRIANERIPEYIAGHERKRRVHLIPFFGDKVLSEITPGLVRQYRVHRAQSKTQMGGPLARATLHIETVILRQVLKAANRLGWLDYVPDLSPPYQASGKVTHRAWFSPDEYKKLFEATRRRAQNPPKERWKKLCEQLHDFVLFMANTGLRPGANTGTSRLSRTTRPKRPFCKLMCEANAVLAIARALPARCPLSGGYASETIHSPRTGSFPRSHASYSIGFYRKQASSRIASVKCAQRAASGIRSSASG